MAAVAHDQVEDALALAAYLLAIFRQRERVTHRYRSAASYIYEVTFTGSIGATVTTIQAVHINQLRSALSEARTAFALASGYTDDPVVAGLTAIKAIHVQEIRDAVK